MNEQKYFVDINLDTVILPGIIVLPENTKSLVIFAHGSGSSRLSPRNRYVAEILQRAGLGTLLFDLLTEEEDSIYENRFDIKLITNRLVKTTEWIAKNEDLASELNLGYFGASTGAAAALMAAVKLGPETIKAVVSRGGRPDLAMEVLEKVQSPTLLIVGGLDDVVLELNRKVLEKLNGPKKLEIVPDATHLFEEPGALEKVAELATDWFGKNLK